ELDIVGPVIAAAAAAFQRLDLGKARLPEAQHVLRQIEILGDFADRPECFGAFRQSGWSPPGPGRACGAPRLFSWSRSRLGRSSPLAPYSPAGSAPLATSAALILCLRTLLGLKTITRRGEIGTSCPVFGLRPTRWPFCLTTKDPNEESFTASPRTMQAL